MKNVLFKQFLILLFDKFSILRNLHVNRRNFKQLPGSFIAVNWCSPYCLCG